MRGQITHAEPHGPPQGDVPQKLDMKAGGTKFTLRLLFPGVNARLIGRITFQSALRSRKNKNFMMTNATLCQVVSNVGESLRILHTTQRIMLARHCSRPTPKLV